MAAAVPSQGQATPDVMLKADKARRPPGVVLVRAMRETVAVSWPQIKKFGRRASTALATLSACPACPSCTACPAWAQVSREHGDSCMPLADQGKDD